MARLTVLLLTYNRLEYAVETLKSTLARLNTAHDLRFHIADDGSGNIYTDHLRNIVESSGIECTITDSERGGYGKNYNLATQVIHQFSDYVLVLEDDWELSRILCVDTIINFLDERRDIGCVRLGYLGFTQQLRGEVIKGQDLNWLLLDPDSSEPHVFAGHPRIEAVWWQKKVGPWPEGLLPGATEFAVTHIRAAREGVVWPLDLVKPSGDLYYHIGTVRSY